MDFREDEEWNVRNIVGNPILSELDLLSFCMEVCDDASYIEIKDVET